MSDRRARNISQQIRDRVSHVGQTSVSKSSGVEKTAVHRVVKGERGLYLDEIPAFLAAIGLHVVDCDSEPVFISAAEYQALATLSAQSADRHARRAAMLLTRIRGSSADDGGDE